MEIKKIVLTGGPCAGKTTALGNIKKYLQGKGVPFISINEIATELIKSGIKPSEKNQLEFESLVVQRLLSKEKDAIKYLKSNYANEEVCVIIYDRAVFDTMAYISDKDKFHDILNNNSIEELDTLADYDMVLCLQSLAICKPDEYNIGDNKNNEARKENLEEAKELDVKTANAWANHHNVKIISSKVSLEEETKTILGYIDELINDTNKTYVNYFVIDEENSKLQKYFDKEALINPMFEKIHKFQVNGNKGKYEARVIKRTMRGSSNEDYRLELYNMRNNYDVKLLNQKMDKTSFTNILLNMGDIEEERKIIAFIEKGFLYKIYKNNDNYILEVQSNTKDENVLIPEDLKIKEYYYQNTKGKKIKERII